MSYPSFSSLAAVGLPGALGTGNLGQCAPGSGFLPSANQMTVHSALDTGTFHRPYLFRISVVLMHIFSIAANMRFSGSIISVSVIRASV
jgi:hypothetical protein